MKVFIVKAECDADLEKKINEFIVDKEVVAVTAFLDATIGWVSAIILYKP